jgi:GNAT superfamily N-acetyltransferase
MSTAVRPATLEDGPALYVRWTALLRYYASVDRRIIPAPVSERDFLAGLSEMLNREGSVAFVAEVDGQLAGFITGGLGTNQPDRLPERHATVGHLWVDQEFRRLGLGRRLFEAVSQWAAGLDDIGHFEMPVLAADASAEQFWKSIGFSPFIQRLWAPLSAPESQE